MQKPPLMPAEVLRRVLRLARFDGISVLALSGLFALGSALFGDFKGAFIGIVIAGAGACELHGVSLLTAGASRGVRWLVNSQLYLLAAVLAYVIWRLLSYDPEQVRRVLESTPEMKGQLEEAGVATEDVNNLLRLAYYLSYAAVGVVTLIYQGGMALYYHRRRAAVAAAVSEKSES